MQQQQSGNEEGAGLRKRRREKVSIMDPDGFGFDSSVNYLDDPCTQMNSPSVLKPAISLPLSEKSKVMFARSSECPQKLSPVPG